MSGLNYHPLILVEPFDLKFQNTWAQKTNLLGNSSIPYFNRWVTETESFKSVAITHFTLWNFQLRALLFSDIKNFLMVVVVFVINSIPIFSARFPMPPWNMKLSVPFGFFPAPPLSKYCTYDSAFCVSFHGDIACWLRLFLYAGAQYKQRAC